MAADKKKILAKVADLSTLEMAELLGEVLSLIVLRAYLAKEGPVTMMALRDVTGRVERATKSLEGAA